MEDFSLILHTLAVYTQEMAAALLADARAVQLLILNNFSEIFVEAGLPISSHPFAVTKPPNPTAVMS